MTEPPLSGPSWLPDGWTVRRLPTGRGFSLSDTCGPVAWAAGRWPDMDWRDGCLVRVANVADGVVPHVVWPTDDGKSLAVAAPALAPRLDLPLVLRHDRTMPVWEDPIIASLAARFAGLRPFAYGSVYLGLVTSIVGQSISVASAATTQRRLAALLAEPIEIAGRRFWPLPAAEVLANAPVDLVRSSGVTWRRAEALVAIGRLAAAGGLPNDQSDWNDLSIDRQIEALRALPLVGPWTARSALLWGTGEDRVWPRGDVALLRAARLAYGPGLDPAGLARLAAGWGTAPGWATRLLWAGLFGTAPATMSTSQDGSIAPLPRTHGGRASSSLESHMYVYVGTYTGAGKGEGIYVFRFDPESGTLTPTETVIGAANPSFLAIDPTNRFVFSANESDPGIVSAFHRDLNTGGLHELNQETSHGSTPCYISIDKPGRYAMVANYGDGTLAVYPIGEDGHLQPSSDVITFTGTGHDPARQDGPHGHMVAPAPDGRYVLATDLGLDTITVYELDTDTGRLNLGSAAGAVAHAGPGAGPRHFTYSPDGSMVFVINELSNTITSYAFADGGLTERQTVPTLPDGFSGENTTAQIAITLDGLHLYGSNRGDDSIVIYSVAEDGDLTLVGHQPTGGQTPRNFALDPTGAWLLVGNQTTGTIVVFRRDPESGLLSQSGDPVVIPSPVAILFAEV